MELTGELIPPDLVGLIPSNTTPGSASRTQSCLSSISPLRPASWTTPWRRSPSCRPCEVSFSYIPNRPDQPPGGRGPVCDEQPSSQGWAQSSEASPRRNTWRLRRLRPRRRS